MLNFCIRCWRIPSFSAAPFVITWKIKALPAKPAALVFISVFWENYALSTFPERKQEVQTYNFLEAPFTLQVTCLMLDFHILLLLLWEWLTLLPKWAALSQIAHLAMIAPPWNILSLIHNRPATKIILAEGPLFCKQNLKKNEIFYEIWKYLFSFFFISGTMTP